MNREIKYRAWLKLSKEMVYNIERGERLDDNFSLYLDNDNAVVMQYTGLKDKNGKEIYEGDVVRTGEEFGEIMYDEQQAAFIILFQPNNKKQKSGCANLASTWPSPLKEVIGNIYENPELLETN